jgi:hypothetical protein
LTVDVDVCPAVDRENLENLAAALGELAATLRDAPPDLPFHADRATLERAELLTLTTPYGDLDVVKRPPGVDGYDELARNAVNAELDEQLVVPIAAIDDLIRMERASGRPKDRIELEVLGALREELDRSV